MHKFSLFILSNYTYSTVQINDTHLSFEAGFGNENFGSVVNLPLHSIFKLLWMNQFIYKSSCNCR